MWEIWSKGIHMEVKVDSKRDILNALIISSNVKLSIHILTMGNHSLKSNWNVGRVFIVYPPNKTINGNRVETYKIKWSKGQWTIDIESGKSWKLQEGRNVYKILLDERWVGFEWKWCS